MYDDKVVKICASISYDFQNIKSCHVEWNSINNFIQSVTSTSSVYEVRKYCTYLFKVPIHQKFMWNRNANQKFDYWFWFSYKTVGNTENLTYVIVVILKVGMNDGFNNR